MSLNNVRLSPTAIATYYDCQRRFFYVYIRGFEEKPKPAMVRGKITHKVLDHFFDFVNIVDIQEGDWEKLWKDFKGVLTSLLNTEWKLIGKEYVDCFKDANEKGEYYEETLRFLDFYAAKLAFSLRNKLNELDSESKWFEHDIRKFFFPKDKELKLVLESDNFAGIVDKTMSLYGNGIAIVDYKTSKSSLPHFIPESHLKQGKAYAYLWKEYFNELPRHVSFYYMRDGESVYYPISNADVEEISKDIEDIRGKEPVLGNFLKNPSKLCLWCDFFKFCFSGKTKDNFLDADK